MNRCTLCGYIHGIAARAITDPCDRFQRRRRLLGGVMRFTYRKALSEVPGDRLRARRHAYDAADRMREAFYKIRDEEIRDEVT